MDLLQGSNIVRRVQEKGVPGESFKIWTRFSARAMCREAGVNWYIDEHGIFYITPHPNSSENVNELRKSTRGTSEAVQYSFNRINGRKINELYVPLCASTALHI